MMMVMNMHLNFHDAKIADEIEKANNFYFINCIQKIFKDVLKNVKIKSVIFNKVSTEFK